MGVAGFPFTAMKTFPLRFATGFSFLVAAFAAGADVLDDAWLKGRAPETVLWPSGEAELHAQPDSAIAALPDGATMYPRRFESR